MKQTIFYSWQSDLPNTTNRGFVEKALDNVAKRIASDDDLGVEPVIDRDTRNVPGSPDIASTILSKIDEAGVAIFDISIINCTARKQRKTPNPNVMFELGYAYKTKGHERIILVFNTAYGKLADVPFDLRGRSIATFHVSEEDEDKAMARKSLEDVLVSRVRDALAYVPEPSAARASIQNAPISSLEKRILQRLYGQYRRSGRQKRWNIMDAYKELGIEQGMDVSVINDSDVISLEGETLLMTTNGIRFMDTIFESDRPLIDLARNFVVMGSSDGNFITVMAKNVGSQPAFDVRCHLEDDAGNRTQPISLASILTQDEVSHDKRYRYTDTPFFTEECKNPRIIFTYRSSDKTEFSSGRFISQEKRADGRFNILGQPGEFIQ